ncbi:hypothetical protein M9H77_11608 [Catharanthus roseus]|uniref:Uncharacterized protein n=1 Tax=Catharanthus roseus TaxID=4058 RepID=A0ACC0BF47_CATRO|nr:hypothetical protein M9H77_11608 [Catharanthus roseus]
MHPRVPRSFTQTLSCFHYHFISNWKNVIGDENCSYRVVAGFVFGDEHQWPDVRRRILYELEHSMNLYVNLEDLEERVNELVHRIHWPVDGPAPYAHWFQTPDSLYIKQIHSICMDINCTTWFYDCVTFVFVFESYRRYIGYWSLDRTTTLYSATVE